MRARWPVLVILGLSACASAPAPVPDLAGCDRTDDFTFVGETTLAALGVAEFAGGQDAIRRGMVWVTAGPVSMNPRRPLDAGGPVDGPMTRVVCVQWPDGSGITTSIDDDWQPPVDLQAAPNLAADEVPLSLGIVLVLAVLVGASFLAFRRDAVA